MSKKLFGGRAIALSRDLCYAIDRHSPYTAVFAALLRRITAAPSCPSSQVAQSSSWGGEPPLDTCNMISFTSPPGSYVDSTTPSFQHVSCVVLVAFSVVKNCINLRSVVKACRILLAFDRTRDERGPAFCPAVDFY